MLSFLAGLLHAISGDKTEIDDGGSGSGSGSCVRFLSGEESKAVRGSSSDANLANC
jgi:hypothetical protein